MRFIESGNMPTSDLPFIDLMQRKYPGIPRERLQARIMAGAVKVNGEGIREPGRKIPIDAVIEETVKRYVSRGGHKLERALDLWNIPVRGRIFIDAGSSTGGFTDCLLQRGAAGIHCVDVGYNQLDYRLRKDSRVYVHERTNIMDCTAFEPAADTAVADLSFRSVIPAALHLLKMTKTGTAVILIKPQFEYRGAPDSFDGVIGSDDELERILTAVLTGLIDGGVRIDGLCRSPLPGRKGNSEFLCRIGFKEMPPESADPACGAGKPYGTVGAAVMAKTAVRGSREGGDS